MPIRFTCPHCDQQTIVEERYAGQEGPCVNCGRSVVVPSDAPRVVEAERPPLAELLTVRRWLKFTLMSMASFALCTSIVALLYLVLGPAVESVRSVALRRRCAGNLEQLALAINAYEQAHGSYPPAFTVGPDGKPWHSWRVLVLPYLGTQANQIYQQYDLAQPWNSPQNLRLVGSMPPVFASPADPDAAGLNETSYFAVVGPGMALAGGGGTSSSRILDGAHQTVLLVEVRNPGIGWTEPRDLDGRAITYTIGNDLGGNHPGGVNVVTADAQTHFLPESLSPEEVHALLTVAGGENVSLAED